MQEAKPSNQPIQVSVIAAEALVRYALSTIIQSNEQFALVRAIAEPERLPRLPAADVLLAHVPEHIAVDAPCPVVRVSVTQSPDRIVAALRRSVGAGPLPTHRTHGQLTARECEVVALVASGYTDHQVADALFLSVRTVRSHLDRIREKTGLRRRADLTRWYIREGNTDAR